LIQSGVVALNTFAPPEGDKYFQRSFEVSLEMSAEAGLEVVFFDKEALQNYIL
jgi:hypothetical protein